MKRAFDTEGAGVRIVRDGMLRIHTRGPLVRLDPAMR